MVAPEMSRAAPVRHPQKARIGTQSGVTFARGTPGANSGCRKCSTAKKRRGTATKTLATMRIGFIRAAASANGPREKARYLRATAQVIRLFGLAAKFGMWIISTKQTHIIPRTIADM